MGTKERKEREREVLKLRILDAAKELFAEDGYKNVTMRKIAEKIEYSLPTIYEYFKNKAEILLEIYYHSGQILLERLQEAYAQRINPLDKILAMGRAYIFFGLENKDFYELTFVTNSVRAEKSIPCSVSELDCGETPAFKTFNLLVQAVNEAQAEGCFKGKDPLLVSQTFWAGIHGLVSLIITQPEFPWVAQANLVENMLSTLIKGSVYLSEEEEGGLWL